MANSGRLSDSRGDSDSDSDDGDEEQDAEEAIPKCEKDGDVLDLRPDFPSAPEGGIEIRAPYIEVPPFSQAFWCYWGTYTGPTVGVTYFEPMESEGYDHHNLLRAVTDEGQEDGFMDICPSSNDMFQYGPLVEASGVEPGPDVNSWLDLPDGVAMKLRENQKWVLDMHYINPTGCTLLVQNGVNIGVLPAEDVVHWAAPLRLDGGAVELPPNQKTTVAFDCEWPTDLTVLSVGSHMHEYGSSYEVDYIKTDGSVERIYEISDWDPDYRNFPVIENFEDGGIQVSEGEAFRTSCSWNNTTSEMIGFPDEMCTTFIAAYPLPDPLTCMVGEWIDTEQ